MSELPLKSDRWKVAYSRKGDEWATPQEFYDHLNAEFDFTLDPCCTHENAKCNRHFTDQENGLIQTWAGERVFCNPPYSQMKHWARKCRDEASRAELIVMLVFARTDTAWFHDYVYGDAELRFIRGRLRFGDSKNSAPAPSMLCIWHKRNTPAQQADLFTV
jgi:site-specific DNA-methyltransferase (adenine-specific)